MDYKSPEFKKWLDKLQQESWQLELIITGFAIYGLFMAIDPVGIKGQMAAANGNATISFVWVIVSIALYILLFNLMLHVLLRGLWIGAIGLRYVSGDIDYEHLNYSPKFTSFLKRKVGSFDRYIAQLENYCSILFAISFLLIFYVLGAFLLVFLLGLLITSLSNLLGDVNKWIMLAILLIIFLLVVAALIVLIDFLGQGFLKRKKWTSIIYFPIYRVFSILTLSFLYRPLIYNFLDNRFGKRLSIFLVPVYISIIFLGSMENRNSNYLWVTNDSSEFYGANKHYDDLSTLQEKKFAEVATIPSKVIETSYLKVFMLFGDEMEDLVYEHNKALRPKNDVRGTYSKYISEFKRGAAMAAGTKDSINLKSYLKTVNDIYRLKIDSKVYSGDFIVALNAKDRLGFETYLNIKALSEGKHVLTIVGPAKEVFMDPKSETIEKTLVSIPFWYYPQNSPSPPPSFAPNLEASMEQ